jgi:hypothetical protein
MAQHIDGEGRLVMSQARVSGVGRVISNFALQHYMAAKLFRDHVQRIEAAHSGQPFDAFFTEIQCYCSACIFSSAAALEALINELFIEHGSPLRSSLRDFETDFWGTRSAAKCAALRYFRFLCRSSRGIEQKPVLEKYQIALKLLNLARFNKSALAYENSGVLIDLRNTLTHFKPTWDSPRKRLVDLEDDLRGKFAMSPFFGSNNDVVTMQCMSAGCATWAVETARAFIAEFGARSKLNPSKLKAFS